MSKIATLNIPRKNGPTRKPKSTRGSTTSPSVGNTTRRTPRATRNQLYGAYATGTVAVLLQGLSLTHLASGIAGITAQSLGESVALAGGIDLGFIALEVATVVALAPIRKLAHPMAIALIVLSSVLNAYAMAAGASTTLNTIVAAALGAIIPALVWVLTKVSVQMFTHR